MKRKLCMCFVLLSLPFQSWGMGVLGYNFDLYFTAGVNAFKPRNSFTGPTSNSRTLTYKYKLGYQAGVLTYFNFAKNINLRTGLLGVHRAFAAENNVNRSGFGTSQNIGLTYIDLPLTVSYYVSNQIHVYAGPVVSYKLSSSSGSSVPGGESLRSENFKRFLFSITLGAHYDVLHNIGVDVYGELGLGSLLKTQTQGLGSAIPSDIASLPLGFGVRVLYKF